MKVIDINKVLEHVGALGKWQYWQGFFLLWIGALAGIGAVIFAITGFVPKHRCVIKPCETRINTTYESLSYLHEEDGCQIPDVIEDVTCQEYVDLIEDKNYTTKSCSELIFDQSEVTSSITEDYLMVCQNAYQRAIFSSLFSVGRLLGSLVIGYISDAYGRMKAITLSIFLVCVSGICETLVNNKAGLAFFRILYGMGGNGCILATFVLAAESTLPQYSVLLTTVPGIGFHVGEFVLAIIAYFVREWKTLQLITHVPALLLLALYFVIPESVRWLNSKGDQIEQVKKILNKRAQVNGKEIPEELFEPIENKSSTRRLGMKDSLKEMFQHKAFCWHAFNCFFQCFCGFFGYYGTLYSATTLSGDPHINFMLAMICGIPGTLLYLVLPDRIGRKATLILAEVILALSCLTGSMLSFYDLYPTLQIVCSMVSRLVAGVSVKACLLCLTELFPTPIRNTAVSIGGIFGGLGSILGLLLEVLELYWKPLPVVIIASTNFFAAVLVFFLPETKGKKLPESFEDIIKT